MNQRPREHNRARFGTWGIVRYVIGKGNGEEEETEEKSRHNCTKHVKDSGDVC